MDRKTIRYSVIFVAVISVIFTVGAILLSNSNDDNEGVLLLNNSANDGTEGDTPDPTVALRPGGPGPSPSPRTSTPTFKPPTGAPTSRPLDPRCVEESSTDLIKINANTYYYRKDYFCLSQGYKFGFDSTGVLSFFLDESQVLWSNTEADPGYKWIFQSDGNLVIRDSNDTYVWHSRTYSNTDAAMFMSPERVWIESSTGDLLWQTLTAPSSEPTVRTFLPTSNSTPDYPDYPDIKGFLQYYAYYYPWYRSGDWSRHGYQDEPLLGKYGTDEVNVAEQHVKWALQTGISTWVVSWWGEDSLSMRHFKGKTAPFLLSKYVVLTQNTTTDMLCFL